MTKDFRQIGFIGLGVMGEPVCRNLTKKSGLRVKVYDLDPAPVDRLTQLGAETGGSMRDVVAGSDIIFLCLPSGEAVQKLAEGPDGLLSAINPGQIVVDLSTSGVDTTRALAAAFAEHGATFIDAPLARTRAAAEAGTLSVMVGADPSTFDTVRPLIATFATEITLCGAVGCGQVVKILNNMILFQIGLAIAEAKAIGEQLGVDPTVLFETLARGSADSFALRNHGMKAILPKNFPTRSFSVAYARKDLTYGLQLASSTGVDAVGARAVLDLFEKAIGAGHAEQYWPVISQLVGSRAR